MRRQPPARRWLQRLLAAATVVVLCSSAHAQRTLAEDLVQLSAWLAGEWNNNEQVWQQKIDAADPKVVRKEDPVEHLHHIVTPVAVPQLGGQVFYVQRSRGDDMSQVRQQRLVRLTVDPVEGAVRQDSYRLPDEPGLLNAHLKPDALAALAKLSPADLKTSVGCEVLWRYDAAAQAFTGQTRPGACMDGTSVPGQNLSQTHTLRLSADQWLLGEQARDAAGQLVLGNKTDTPLRSRKVQYYEGWVWFKVAGPGAAADDKNTSFTAKYLLHNEGQRMVVNHSDGRPSPYMLELALLTYQNTRRPVLKWALLDRQTLKSLSYVWTEASSPTVGMNLGWFQAGVTRKAERASFGFGLPAKAP